MENKLSFNGNKRLISQRFRSAQVQHGITGVVSKNRHTNKMNQTKKVYIYMKHEIFWCSRSQGDKTLATKTTNSENYNNTSHIQKSLAI